MANTVTHCRPPRVNVKPNDRPVTSGATGFTARSDIEPARDSTDVPETGTGPPSKKPKEDAAKDNEESPNDNNNVEFEGYADSLFAKDPYDKEDEEEDEVYLDCKRTSRRSSRKTSDIVFDFLQVLVN
ncbi:hypothetical protein KIN20_032902 [Parelaphostrongylus tenuis]|uniref:PRP1 splicing factor N-terminal domain-containing protein n=1 Tax=Parelaphostrongylus tenuis TaxID=148309 RepID=A0AAD5WI00_PARTN|nr:hypothetical protein KIN20_032902 [Parelaphostrongylus tenuis]